MDQIMSETHDAPSTSDWIRKAERAEQKVKELTEQLDRCYEAMEWTIGTLARAKLYNRISHINEAITMLEKVLKEGKV
jgi:flagellin-specific chaperone FliS